MTILFKALAFLVLLLHIHKCMKKLIFLALVLGALKVSAADETSVLSLEKATRFSISSSLIYENLGSQSFMVQVGAALKTRSHSAVGIAGGITPSASEGGGTPDSFVQLFWENKNWVYSANYNWLDISKFASAGLKYNFDIYHRKNISVRSDLGIDIIAQQIPSDFMIRTGLLSFAPKLGVSVAFDL